MAKYTKKLLFSEEVRLKVWERAKGRCEMCGNFYPVDYHHIYHRSQLGLGIEQNCILLCRQCHEEFHSHKMRDMRHKALEYLSQFYSEEELLRENLTFSKWR